MANVDDLVIRAAIRDELSGPLKDIRGELGHVRQELEKTGDTATGTARKTDQLDSSLRKADRSGQGMAKTAGVTTKSLAKLGAAAIVGSAAGRAVGDFFRDSITQASNLNETLNKSSVIFGSHAKDMEKWASKAATTLGLSKQAALDSAAGFGNMFSQIGFSGGQAAAMSRDVVKLSADLGSFNNLPTAEVNEMISASFRGEFDSLQRVIPNINAARVEHEALAKTGKKTAKELTAQEKAAATLAIIHKDGAAALNDFAETSDGAANKSKILTAKMDDLKGQVGQKLLPVWVKFLDMLSKTVTWLSKHPKTFGVIAAVIGTVLVAALVGATVAAWGFTAALLANPITWVVIAIVAFIAIMVLLYKKFHAVRVIVDALWAVFKFGVKVLWNIGEAVGKFLYKWTGLKWIIEHWDKITHGIQTAIDKLQEFFGLEDERDPKTNQSKNWRNERGEGSSLIVPGSGGQVADTHTRRGRGGNLGHTLAAHAGVNAALGGGYRISNALIGGGGRGRGSGDHQAGRALDVTGRNLSAYAREVRRRGGYAAIHGQGSGKHVHAVMGDTATGRSGRMSGPGGSHVTIQSGAIVIHAGNASPAEIRDLVEQLLREIARDAEEMSDA